MLKADVAVVGAGPAGTALVGELARLGVDVVWVAPDINDAWHPRYGTWVDDFPEHLRGVFTDAWHHPKVGFFEDLRSLDRMYARIDNDRLKEALLAGTEGVRKIERPWVSGEVEARLKVDATGSARVLGGGRSPNPAFQTAWGILADIRGEPLGGADMALMDFRDVASQPDWAGPATFLYAMRLDDGRWFLEETVLAARPAVAIGDLKTRLEARLAERGVEVLKVYETERCAIAMGEPIPKKTPGTFSFGAAASYVHPATGYSVARTLRAAPDVAKGLSEVLDGAPEDHAWHRVWPASQRDARRFYAFGLEALLKMDPDTTRRFFDSFFELPQHQWAAYLADSSGPAEVASIMLKLYARISPGLKWELTRAAFQHFPMLLTPNVR